MPQTIYRTHATNLSEGELALLDVLFKYRADFRCLKHKGFELLFNHRSHRFDNARLKEVLSDLCRRGVLQFDATNSVFSMTTEGCELWSLERCPVWERFASERYGQQLSGKETISIVATGADTLDEILTVGSSVGMWGDYFARVRIFQIRNHELLPSRKFPMLHAAVVICKPFVHLGHSHDEDVLEYERRRTWWRNVNELQKVLDIQNSAND
jgi:hypothetical protein